MQKVQGFKNSEVGMRKAEQRKRYDTQGASRVILESDSRLRQYFAATRWCGMRGARLYVKKNVIAGCDESRRGNIKVAIRFPRFDVK